MVEPGYVSRGLQKNRKRYRLKDEEHPVTKHSQSRELGALETSRHLEEA